MAMNSVKNLEQETKKEEKKIKQKKGTCTNIVEIVCLKNQQLFTARYRSHWQTKCNYKNLNYCN